MINTSYFAKYKGNEGVSIARFNPKNFEGMWFPQLAPSESLLNWWNSLSDEDKKNDLNIFKYTEIYKEETLKLLEDKIEDLYNLLDNKVLLCYEKSESFCHRHIVAEWFKAHGYDCEELEYNDKFYTSYSMMDCYKSCPQSYEYKYIEGLKSKSKKRSLYVGEHIHKLIELLYVHKSPDILEQRKAQEHQLYNMLNPDANIAEDVLKAYYNTLTWRKYLVEVIQKEYNNLSEDDRAEMGENYIVDLARIMAQYEYYYSNDNITFVDIEHNKTCPLGTYNSKEVILNYICDGIVKLPDGKLYIIEHKSYSKEPMTFEQTWLNTQTSIYVSALKSAGYNIEGVLWDNIKSTAPKKPNVLKSGAFGKQDSNVTLFSFVDYDTIMEGAEAVIEYISKLPKEVTDLEVEGNKDNFLSRHITIFNEKAVDTILADTSKVLNEITKEEPVIYRNMGWTCNGCAFKELCQAQMLGQDDSLIRSTMFEKKVK